MANWANPTITSNYVTFVDEVKARDVDAITLQAAALVSPPVSSIKLVRSPVKFQEWNGTAFVDLVLSPAGGGTGLTSLGALAGSLGLGSMAFQNANSVNITGGALSTISLVNTVMGGNAQYNGTGFQFVAYQYFTPVNITGPVQNWSISITGAPDVDKSYGFLMSAGSSKADTCFLTRNAAGTKYGLTIRGDMGVFCATGLVIPVGTNAYVTS